MNFIDLPIACEIVKEVYGREGKEKRYILKRTGSISKSKLTPKCTKFKTFILPGLLKPLYLWCGDGRRIRRLSEWGGHPFANDHLDASMNATVDAGIAVQTFIIAAESIDLDCCPVSEIRDQITPLSAELELPKWVFPVAGLCVGWPAEEPRISLRLPLHTTIHLDRYDDNELFEQVADYDRRREAIEPTPPEQQRTVDKFGISAAYGWSENRTRQYAVPARTDFGGHICDQGFDLS